MMNPDLDIHILPPRPRVSGPVLLDMLTSDLSDAALFEDVLHQVRTVSSGVRDVKALAGIADVAPVTLRRRFRKRFGVTLSDFMSDFRLDWAHERLTSGFESRPISEMAIAAGFRDSVAFTRAYKRRFGNSPSQSRAEAIKLMCVK